MAWAVPRFSKSKVDAAGRALVARPIDDFNAYAEAFDVLNNWRSSHSFPLNTFQNTLRHKAAKIDENFVVAQRIKRLSSIELKLRRFNGLRLSQIQDIGGCRVVLSNVDKVVGLLDLYKKSDLRHKLVRVDDYLTRPQKSGYRGIHLIYRYHSERGGKAYNDLQIEMQLRSQLQHAWATAVETVGTFTQQALKSSQGHDDYLRFFQLMGTLIALQEGTSPVFNTPIEPGVLVEELRGYVGNLDIINRLELYGLALNSFEDVQAVGGHYFLLVLDPVERSIRVQGFPKNQLEHAQNEYLKIEKGISESGNARDAVLVSADSTAALKRAYPNYFLDTRNFLGVVKAALSGSPLEVQDDPVSPT